MGKAEDDAVRYRAPALDKGLDILELLAGSSVALTQAEIAKGLGRGANEIYRMLDTLVRRGYVTRSPDGDRYLLSLRLLVLADMHPPRRRLLDAAEPLMRQFARSSEQSVHLAMMEDEQIVISSSFSAPGNWRLSLRTGAVIGLYNTASGLVLTAFKPPQDRRRILRHYEPLPGETVIDGEAFEQQATLIRKAGRFVGESTQAIGVLNMSFPILDPFGNAIAALTCPYVPRVAGLTCPDQDATIEMLGTTASEISQQLFGPGTDIPQTSDTAPQI